MKPLFRGRFRKFRDPEIHRISGGSGVIAEIQVTDLYCPSRQGGHTEAHRARKVRSACGHRFQGEPNPDHTRHVLTLIGAPRDAGFMCPSMVTVWSLPHLWHCIRTAGAPISLGPDQSTDFDSSGIMATFDQMENDE